jgi:hypothetical protein
MNIIRKKLKNLEKKVLQCHSIHYKSHTQSAGSDPKTVTIQSANHLIYLRLLICECVGFYHYTGQHIINIMRPIIQHITQNEHKSTTELDYIAMHNQISSLKWE